MTTQNALAILSGAKISDLARQSKFATQELGAGIAAPFAVIGYKGGRWSVRHRGVTTVLQRFDASGRPDGFVPFLDLVILQAASHHSKIYYAKAYTDGDDEIPDCWSTNGVVPDQAAPRKQAPTCAQCKWNEFGSRTNAATGAKGKACADIRRMAVTPYLDIENVAAGGPMLLRVPPASLGAVGEYSDMLKANSIPYSAVATRIGFDPREAYPKMIFEPYAILSDVEMAKVLTMQAHPLCDRIVQEQVENMVAQVGSEQGVPTPNTANTTAQPGAGVQAAPDPGPIPEALRRPTTPAVATTPPTNGAAPPVTPQVTPPAGGSPFAQAINTGPSYPGQKAAEPAPAPTPPLTAQTAQHVPEATPAPPEVPLTAEQLRIRELEAQLEAAKAGTPATRAPRKARTPAVAPQATAEPAPQQQAAAAPPAQPQGEEDGSGSGAVVPSGDPAFAALSARLNKILT